MPRRLPHRLALALLIAVAGPAAAVDLTTHAERSGFVETGRYDETIALCDAFQAAYPDAVRCFDFGTTPEGRPMKALAVSRSGALTPEAARDSGIPVVLMQGGIHAGEIDGKDAGFLALREALDGDAATGTLEQLVWVFVPVFNVDGHERFGAWNRPNQRGPREMGWRTTAQNLNLNRDYAKAEAPEMQAMLALVEAWDPIAYIDLHATNGAQFEHDISIQVEPLHAGDDALRAAGLQLRDGVMADLAAQGSLPLPFYPSFVRHDEPDSGFVDGVSPRASPPATSCCATGWRCWSKPTPGRNTRCGCGSPATPSCRCSTTSPAMAATGCASRTRPTAAPRRSAARTCRSTGAPPMTCARWISAAMPTPARHRTSPAR